MNHLKHVEYNKYKNSIFNIYFDSFQFLTGFLQTQLEKSGIRVKPLIGIQQYGQTRTQQEIDELERTLQEISVRMTQLNESQSTLTKRYLELTELRHVLRFEIYAYEN